MKSDDLLRLIAIGTTLVMLGLLTAGCGKKGDPIPPRIKPIAAVTFPNLDAVKIHVGARQENYKVMNPREDHNERFQL